MTDLTTLLTLADSRLPTGGHVHSGGVEEAIASGLLVDLPTLAAFLRRRIRTQGLVSASIGAAVHAETLGVKDAEGNGVGHVRVPAPHASLVVEMERTNVVLLLCRLFRFLPYEELTSDLRIRTRGEAGA